jgi:hypothetical protein
MFCVGICLKETAKDNSEIWALSVYGVTDYYFYNQVISILIIRSICLFQYCVINTDCTSDWSFLLFALSCPYVKKQKIKLVNKPLNAAYRL